MECIQEPLVFVDVDLAAGQAVGEHVLRYIAWGLVPPTLGAGHAVAHHAGHHHHTGEHDHGHDHDPGPPPGVPPGAVTTPPHHDLTSLVRQRRPFGDALTVQDDRAGT